MTRAKKQSYNEWLVIRAQQGDRQSITLLLQQWQPRYYLYALKRLENREAALDVTQECLLSINRGLGSLTDPAAYPKWSFRILERRCVDWLRKLVREKEVLTTTSDLPEVAVDSGDGGHDSRATVETVLRGMDSNLATVLRLFYLEEFSVTEIAEVLNVPPGTVKSRLYYGRKQFIVALEENGDDSHE